MQWTNWWPDLVTLGGDQSHSTTWRPSWDDSTLLQLYCLNMQCIKTVSFHCEPPEQLCRHLKANCDPYSLFSITVSFILWTRWICQSLKSAFVRLWSESHCSPCGCVASCRVEPVSRQRALKQSTKEAGNDCVLMWQLLNGITDKNRCVMCTKNA